MSSQREISKSSFTCPKKLGRLTKSQAINYCVERGLISREQIKANKITTPSLIQMLREYHNIPKKTRKKGNNKRTIKQSSPRNLNSDDSDYDDMSIISSNSSTKKKKVSYRKDHSSDKNRLCKDSCHGAKCQGDPKICALLPLIVYMEEKEKMFNSKEEFINNIPTLMKQYLNNFEVDHIHELAESHNDDFENLQLLCKSCHKYKTEFFNKHRSFSFEERRKADSSYRYMTRSKTEKQRVSGNIEDISKNLNDE